MIELIGATWEGSVANDPVSRRCLIHQLTIKPLGYVRVMPGSWGIEDGMDDSAIRCKVEDVAAVVQARPSIIVGIL